MEEDWEEFKQWYEENEGRFAHGQYYDDQIAYAAWLESRSRVLGLCPVCGYTNKN